MKKFVLASLVGLAALCAPAVCSAQVYSVGRDYDYNGQRDRTFEIIGIIGYAVSEIAEAVDGGEYRNRDYYRTNRYYPSDRYDNRYRELYDDRYNSYRRNDGYSQRDHYYQSYDQSSDYGYQGGVYGLDFPRHYTDRGNVCYDQDNRQYLC